VDWKKFAVRALVAVIFGPLILLSAWYGGAIFAIFIGCVSLLGLHEFYGMITQNDARPLSHLGLAVGVLLNTCVYFYGTANLWQLFTAALLLLIMVELFRGQAKPTANLAATWLGIFYVPFLLGFLLLIRALPVQAGWNDTLGAKMIILIFLCIWICDTAAYMVGSRIGRHKLFPRVSPNKTVEGTVFGLLFAVAAAYLCQISFLADLPVEHVLIVGVICGSIGQLSDLVESLFKRDAGVKDSSKLIPGHGGVLDRFDSPMLVAPVVYGYLKFVVF